MEKCRIAGWDFLYRKLVTYPIFMLGRKVNINNLLQAECCEICNYHTKISAIYACCPVYAWNWNLQYWHIGIQAQTNGRISDSDFSKKHSHTLSFWNITVTTQFSYITFSHFIFDWEPFSSTLLYIDIHTHL